MRRWRTQIHRKRRTREHVIADLSINHLERLVLRCGWVVHALTPDYGVDLFMETFTRRGEIENGCVWFQVKATESVKVIEGDVIPVRMEWRDLLFWLNEDMPGILVIYEAAAERAWWLHLQGWLRDKHSRLADRTASTVTLHVPTANVLGEAAVRQFARLRNAQKRGRS